jgi:hypothetical protein
MHPNDPVPEKPEPDEIPEDQLDQVSGGAFDAYLIINGQKNEETNKKP